MRGSSWRKKKRQAAWRPWPAALSRSLASATSSHIHAITTWPKACR